MNIENVVVANQEKHYEIEARKYFIEKIFPTKIFQNYMSNDTGAMMITEKDEQGNLKLPKTEYNPLEQNIYYDANNQLSIENLSAIVRLFKDWWIDNEDYARYQIKIHQLKLGCIQFDPIESERRQKNYVGTLNEYESEKTKGLDLANPFLKILEEGREQETLFEKTRNKLNSN